MAKYGVVELFTGRDCKWYFHKKSRNGKITQPSQGYIWKSSAVKAAKRDIPNTPIVLRSKEV